MSQNNVKIICCHGVASVINQSNMDQAEEGGSLVNLTICYHLLMRVVMVSLRPELECIKLLSCSIFTFFIPSSMSISLFKKSSFAIK